MRFVKLSRCPLRARWPFMRLLAVLVGFVAVSGERYRVPAVLRHKQWRLLFERRRHESDNHYGVRADGWSSLLLRRKGIQQHHHEQPAGPTRQSS